jgi:PAS domain S-box-containing protein
MTQSIRASLSSRLFPLAAAALAIVIFLIDTFSPLGMAVAVLYVIVVLIAANFCEWRGVLLVALGCGALTLISFSISHGTHYESPAFARCLVSLSAIAITSFLVLKNKSSETVLREQASLLDVTHDAVFVRDANNVITYWNRGAEELYGWSGAEAIGRVPQDLLQTIFPRALEDITSILLRTGRWEGELVHTKRDGKQVTVASRWSLQRGKQGLPVAILETNNDVTERMRAEDALRKSEAYLAEAQRLSLTGSFGWDIATNKLVWSHETYRIFQLDPAAEPTVNLVVQRTHPADVALVLTLIKRATRDGKDWGIEHRLLMPDGSIKFVNVVAHAARDASGNIEFVGAIMDVTAARRAEVALQQAQSNLAHVNRVTTIGEMTASISHEVSQPIAAIVTNAGAGLRWLSAQPSDLEETKLALSRICKDGKRASEIITRIRALARKVPPRKDRLSINEMILEVIALMRGEADRNHVVVHTALSDDLPLVFGDRIQLQQVILNLVVNAVEAMGAVPEGKRELSISSETNGSGGILVAVGDCGPGIDPMHIDRLFEAFYTTKPAGIGLGLAICRSIIEAHDGRLWATQNGPQGARFQFSLPGGEEIA